MNLDPLSSPTFLATALVLLAAVIGLLVRLLKSDKMNLMLASLGLPAIPKRALPWVAGGLGLAAGVINAVLKGAPWSAALSTAVLGLFAGAGATWGHEAGIEGVANGKEVGGGGIPRAVNGQIDIADLSDAFARVQAAVSAKVPTVVSVDGDEISRVVPAPAPSGPDQDAPPVILPPAA